MLMMITMIKPFLKLIGVVLLFLIFVGVGCYSIAHAADFVFGDSIAQGAGRALHVPTAARQGAGSCEIARRFKPHSTYAHILISAGINDGGTCDLKVRSGLSARRVTWILPAPINSGALAAWNMVKLYGDGFVTYACKGVCTKSNFHPASYAVVARAVRRDWNKR